MIQLLLLIYILSSDNFSLFLHTKRADAFMFDVYLDANIHK